MIRVSKVKPCPICGKPDWCLVASDASAAICARIEAGSCKRCKAAGWLHILEKRDFDRKVSRKFRLNCLKRKAKASMADMQSQFIAAMTPDRYFQVCSRLGLSVDSLKRLQVGWDGQAFCFPMKDAGGEIIGIRRRLLSGKKLCVRGSAAGLFVPLDLSGKGYLIIAEGNTDTAAGLDLGFDTIGRPSCCSDPDPIAGLCRGRDVVIIPDNDIRQDDRNPGMEGGSRLAKNLMLYARSVRLICPLGQFGDLRSWLQAGLTHQELTEVIERTAPFHLTMGFKVWK